MTSDTLRLKVLTQEFRDVLYQLKDAELLQILRDHCFEAMRLLALIESVHGLQCGTSLSCKHRAVAFDIETHGVRASVDVSTASEVKAILAAHIAKRKRLPKMKADLHPSGKYKGLPK